MGRQAIVEMIIEACRKRYGQGEVFYRGDGLAFEERRAAKRAAYLRAHPETRPEYRELIERGGLTPGMSHAESIAAWGLIEEDMRDTRGRETADEQHHYTYYYGFNVGRPYVLHLIDSTVVGVLEDTEGRFYGRAWRERQGGG